MLRFREWRDKYLKEEKTDEEKPDKPFRRDENRDSDVHIES
jgi:hypothetical protein